MQRIEPNFLQSVGNVYNIGSILQVSYNKEILLFAQCLQWAMELPQPAQEVNISAMLCHYARTSIQTIKQTLALIYLYNIILIS